MNDYCCHEETTYDGVCMSCGLVVDSTPNFGMEYSDEQYYYGSGTKLLGTYIKPVWSKNGRRISDVERNTQNRIMKCHLYTQTREKREVGHDALRTYRTMFDHLHQLHGMSRDDITACEAFLVRVVNGEFGVYRAERMNGLVIAYIRHRSVMVSTLTLKTFLPNCLRKHILCGQRRIAELLKQGLVM